MGTHEFECDRCKGGIGIQELALLGSVDNSCNPFTDMTTLCRSCIHDELEDVTSKMDIPEMRRRDTNWLNRNIGIRNSDNEHIDYAILLISAINQQKVVDPKS